MHDQGPDRADVTEGSGGVWERLQYDSLGWRLDADFLIGDAVRVVQFTPPRSNASIALGGPARRATVAGERHPDASPVRV